MPNKSDTIRIAEVHFGEPPTGGYSYIIPEGFLNLEAGCRVRVPFGNRERTGFVTDISTGRPDMELKCLSGIIDESPLLPPDVLDLTRWLADYYLCDPGEAISAAFPAGLKSGGKTRFRLSPDGKAEPWIATESGHSADLWRALQNTPLSLQQIKNRFPDGELLLGKFKKRGWIETVDSNIVNFTQNYEIVYFRTDRFSAELTSTKIASNAIKQTALAALLVGSKSLGRKDIFRQIVSPAGAISAFLKRGWIEARQVAAERSSGGQNSLQETAGSPPELSEAQRSIVDEISDSINKQVYQPFLLHGVTGSGKSLIYLEAVASALRAGKSALVMVPEISLTPQLAGRLQRRFGELVGIVHSGLENRERQAIWLAARSGKIRVVVGPRSAIFTPLSNLGLIVVDEEHDDSYKQDAPPPRYHGKAAAYYRASRSGATLLLGSATPDIVSYYNALQGRIKLLQLMERHQQGIFPDVRVVKWGGINQGSLFSPQLRDRISDRLNKHQQIILLVNRRGFATIIICGDCGESIKCPNCDITLRYHRADQKLECHYCGFRRKVTTSCPVCSSPRLKFNGIGTQRVEKELDFLFPEARTVRLDLDTSRQSGVASKVLNDFAVNKYDVLLGTQMVAKGHDFPNVTLVGILGADFEFVQSDFRSLERGFRLLVQASGRAGRSNLKGEVVIQCINPTHPVLRWVQATDYLALFKAEIAYREQLCYPPFGRIVSITLRSEEQSLVEEAGNAYRKELEAISPEAKILGPATPEIERLEGLFRRRLMVKLPAHSGSTTAKIKTGIKSASEIISKRFGSAKLYVTIDVDAIEV